MKKNKLLIIGPFPEPVDGCSLANEVLKNNLEKNGYFVQTVNTATKVLSSKQGTSFSFKKVFNFLHIYLGLSKVINSNIVYTTPGQTFYGVVKYLPFYFTCNLFKIPYIIHLHGNYLGKEYQRLNGVKKKLFGSIIRRAAAGIVLSESMRNNFRELLPPNKIYVVNNFVQDLFYQKDVIKKRTDKLRLLYLSNLMEEKGILIFFDLLRTLKLEGIDFHAEVAGKIEKSIEDKIIDNLNYLAENVSYLGIVSGVEKLKALENANVFVLPTYYSMEGQPISILEAMATGNIIISTNHAGIPDVVGPNNGFTVDLDKMDLLYIKTKELSNNLSESIGKISETNRMYAKTYFTESLFYLKISNILNELSKS